MDLIVGQRIDVDKMLISKKIKFKLNLSFSKILESYNLYCIALNKDEQLISDKYIISNNQPSSPDEFIKKIINKNEFEIDIDLVPNYVQKINLILCINENGNLKNIANGYIRIFNENREVANFKFYGENYVNQKSLILLELYRRKDIWKIAVVANGFEQNFKTILTKYYIDKNLKNNKKTTIEANNSISKQNELNNVKIEAQKLLENFKRNKNAFISRDKVIYPRINDKFEHEIKINNEIYNNGFKNYYFSSQFKLSNIILKNITEKYIKNYSKYDYEYKITHISEDDIKINPNKDMLAFYYDGNESIIFKKEKIYFVKDKKEYFFYEVEIQEKKLINIKDSFTISENIFPKGFVDFFNELKALNKKISIDEITHPLVGKVDIESYLDILIYMCCFKKELVANQILLLEQIARQLRISSKYVSNIINLAIRMDERIYLDKVNEIKKHFNKEYTKFLLVDLAYLDVLGKNKGKDSRNFITFIEKEFQIQDLLLEEIENNFKYIRRVGEILC